MNPHRMLAAMALCVSLLVPIGRAAADPGSSRWQKLRETCEKDWSAYEQALMAERTSLKKEFGSLSAKEFAKLNMADDPSVILVKATWPGDLEGKDQFWGANKDCADLHWEVRKTLANAGADKKDKQEKVRFFETCLLSRYDRKKVVAPLDQLVACYKKLSQR